MKNEKIKELETVIDNLLVQNGLSMAKQSAMIIMILGIYKETFEPERFKSIANQFINIWEENSLLCLNDLEDLVFDPAIISRQKLEVKANIDQLKEKYL